MKKIITITAFALLLLTAYGFRIGGFREDTTVPHDLYIAESLFVGDALVDTGSITVLGKSYIGNAAADTIFNVGVVIDSSNHIVMGDLTVSGKATSKFDEVVKAATDSIKVAECKGTLINNYGQGAASTLTLPTAVEGYALQIVITDTDDSLYIDVQGTDKFYLDGVALDDGDRVTNGTPAVGDMISIISVQTGASEWNWIANTIKGTWADGG
uniref:Uncharacterized protein n=1 Tax=viral metagenome TaxID=1070528 RepID=A0A6M3KHE8_9ZZZZ